ncbi:MAG: hypothetical protein ABEL76_08120 [Bradymonadaceae bacterium]
MCAHARDERTTSPELGGRGWLVALAVCLGFAAATGCETRRIGDGSAGGEQTLVFSDDFERKRLGDDWHRGQGENGSGEWSIDDGWIAARSIRNDPLWLDRELPKKVRVEWKAKALTDRGDLKVEIFGDGENHESGYILIFGGWDNSLDVIARLDEHGDDRKEQKTEGVEKGKVYRMAVERTDGQLRWYIDGELHMTYDDPSPLRGEGHRHFAFNNWEVPVRYDDLRVYRLSGD